MAKKHMVSGLLLVASLCLGIVFYGCGQVVSTSTPSAVPTTVTFTGTAAASSADLAKIGATAFGVESQAEKNVRINSLKAMGFDEGSVNALNLRTLSAANTTVALNKVNADGSYTAVDSETLGADGSYNLTDEAYSTSNLYVITCTKTSTTASRELVIETPVDQQASAGTSTLTALNSTPQTTLLVQLIMDRVVEELGTALLDAEAIRLIKSIVIDAINGMITTEGLSLSNVKTITATENNAMKSAGLEAFNNAIISKAIKALKFKAGFSKGATTLATAKKIIKEVFTYITGSTSGIPENIVNSFAQSYVDGVTKTVAQLAAACDKSVTKNGQSASGIFTAANVAAAIQSKISATYQTAAVSSGVNASGPGFGIKSQDPIVQAVFPASEWAGKTIDGSTVLNVPQLMVLIEIGQSIAAAAGAQFNPPKVAYELGLMTGVEDKFQIMHSELRIESWEDWQNFNPTQETRPIIQSVLTSFMDVGNVVNPAASGTNLTAKLFYQKSNGTETSADYIRPTGGFGPKAVSAKGVVRSQEMGPPPGFVFFQISPWGQPGSTTTITDFKRGTTATIRVYNSGVAIATKEVAIASVDLSSAAIQFKTPYPDIFDGNSPLITTFQTNTKPVFSWTFGNVNGGSSTINFGSLISAYAIEVRSVEAGTDRPNYSGMAIYSSWNGDFIQGRENESINFTLPTALASGTYSLSGAVIAIDANGWPVVSGPWRSTLFKVGTASQVASTVVTIEGAVTPPTTRQSGTTIKVGLFRMSFDTNLFGSSMTPTVVAALDANNNFSMTINYSALAIAGFGGYDTIAWEDDGDGVLEGAAGERPYFPSKHLEYHGGTLNIMDQNFNPAGQVTATQNRTGYDINMANQFWGP